MGESALPGGESCDLCVVGAGISGLCLARLAVIRRGLRTVVLEQRDQPGGCLCTAPVEPDGWLELGAHTCYNSYTGFLDIMTGTDFLGKAVPRKSLGFRIVEGGRVRSIPSCLSFLEAAFSLPRILRETKAGQTAASYYSRVLGKRNWARVMHPMLNAVVSQEAEAFPADALFQPRPARRKDVFRSFALRGGLGGAARDLAELPGMDLRPASGAVALAREGEGFRVTTSRGETLHARHVALAVPANAAASLLAGAFPEAAALLSRMEIRTVRSLGVVFSDPLAHLPPLTGLVLPEGPCFSAVSADTFPVPGKRAWTFHFDGARMADHEPAMLDYACQVAGCSRAEVETYFRRDHPMPAIRLGHGPWREALDRSIAGSGLMLAGNYLAGLSIEDCANRALREYRRVLEG